jgi:hypothetical protein
VYLVFDFVDLQEEYQFGDVTKKLMGNLFGGKNGKK